MAQLENDNQFHQHTSPGSPVARLADLGIGRRARIVEVDEPGAAGERLLEMGLTRGTHVHIVRRGLFGDPIQLALRGIMLSVRRDQARHIAVEPLV